MAQIKHKTTGEIIFEDENISLKDTISNALKEKISLQYANLSNLDLIGVNFENADLGHADLSNSNMQTVEHSAVVMDSGAYQDVDVVDFSGANLQYINFFGANLSGVKFYGADLSNAILNKSDLSFADLRKSTIRFGVFNNANLYAADLSGCDLQDATLFRASLSAAILWNVNLERAVLFDTIFIETKFENTNFKDAGLGNTVFGLSDLSKCDNLDTVLVQEKCVIDFESLRRSPHIPKLFLQKIGLPDHYIDYLPELYDDQALIYHPVFLSHNSTDKPFARKLYDALSRKGILTWFDEKNMRAGEKIYERISNRIKAYDKLILVCSKDALSKSWWIEQEINEARRKEESYFKQHGKTTNIILPIMIDDYALTEWKSDNSNYIASMHIENFIGWEDEKIFEDAFNRLVEALNSKRKDDPYSLLGLSK